MNPACYVITAQDWDALLKLLLLLPVLVLITNAIVRDWFRDEDRIRRALRRRRIRAIRSRKVSA